MVMNEATNGQIFKMTQTEAKFNIGQLVTHKLLDYRGVIVDIDPVFLGTEEWYKRVAKTSPPKNAPWYKVLVNKSLYETYVAERNLQVDISTENIEHPMIHTYFDELNNGKYINRSWQLN